MTVGSNSDARAPRSSRRIRAVSVVLAWSALLAVVSALHVQLNRGGWRHVLRERTARNRLVVGHLPVT